MSRYGCYTDSFHALVQLTSPANNSGELRSSSIAKMSYSSSSATFGIEMEFLLECLERDATNQAQAITLLSQALAATANVPVAGLCRCRGRRSCIGCTTVPLSNRNIPGNMTIYTTPLQPYSYAFRDNSDRPRYEYYFVNNELLIGPDNTFGMEIATPVRRIDEVHSELPELRRVVEALRQLPQSIFVHSGCGLHVHVGTQNALKLETAAKYLTMIAVLERPLLIAMQPQERQATIMDERGGQVSRVVGFSMLSLQPDPVYPLIPETWANAKEAKLGAAHVNAHVPVHARSESNYFWRRAHGQDILEFLHGVWTATSLEQLALGIKSLRRGKIGANLAIRLDPGSGSTESAQSTVEVRYSHMTFDVQYIHIWTAIVCRILEISELNREDFGAVMGEILNAVAIWDSSRPQDRFASILQAMGFSFAQIRTWTPIIEAHRLGQDPFQDIEGRLQ